MRQATSFVILVGAAALVACASQAPAPSAGTAASHASVAAPATSAGTAATHASVAASAFAAADKDKTDKTPYGYRRVVVDGEERFCRSDPETGSHLRKNEVCLTQAQLQAQQDHTKSIMNDIQRHGTETSVETTPGAGGAMTGR